MTQQKTLSLGGILYYFGALLAAFYFSFSAVNGDYGVFRRAEVRADIRAAQATLDEVNGKLARMENLTHRLSDDYLDLDLLDERARDVLGQMRADEIAIR